MVSQNSLLLGVFFGRLLSEFRALFLATKCKSGTGERKSLQEFLHGFASHGLQKNERVSASIIGS